MAAARGGRSTGHGPVRVDPYHPSSAPAMQRFDALRPVLGSRDRLRWRRDEAREPRSLRQRFTNRERRDGPGKVASRPARTPASGKAGADP